MKAEKTQVDGAIVIEPDVFGERLVYGVLLQAQACRGRNRR